MTIMWSDGSRFVPDMSMRSYSIIKDGKEIKSMYGDISQVRPKADELGADQIYDGGEFYMTDYGIGNKPKTYLSLWDQEKKK